MDTQEGTYTYTGYNNQKYKVPIERVYSFSLLHRADHIAMKRADGLYWHHAIVDDVETEKDTINVIEYSNSTEGFSQDNSSHPKDPGIARVIRGKYSGSKDGFYLIKHKKCEPTNTVVLKAKGRLGENEYSLFNNNCEHFALWCKTGISSSEQVENIGKTVRKRQEKILKCALPSVARVAAQTTSESGEEIVTTMVRETTKKVVTQTEQAEQAEQVVSETVSNGGKEILKMSSQTTAEQVVSETVLNGGKEFLKMGSETAGEHFLGQSVLNGGKGILKMGTETAGEHFLGQSVLNGGQQVLTSGSRETTKEIFSHTAKKAGEEIVTKGTRETTREVVTQTSTTTGNSAGESLVGGALAVVCEAAFASNDICANKDLKEGNISEKEYNDAVGKRIVGGVGSVTGSFTGAVLGQLVFPFGGGFVGSVVGGLAGGYLGGALWGGAK
ncbi:uncharacterized protein LOC141866505 [Acropora palmata]|uniref:uncharacterized protein LOC141866505 n=1 Tax=Acropora palmata TaxID=6131 RepID=UPI003DA0B745